MAAGCAGFCGQGEAFFCFTFHRRPGICFGSGPADAISIPTTAQVIVTRNRWWAHHFRLSPSQALTPGRRLAMCPGVADGPSV